MVHELLLADELSPLPHEQGQRIERPTSEFNYRAIDG
jgi:hypothetical protein